ncbi:MAG: Asp-tRNA(Asn)/Glu-tRNA(Gln) amidotransferase subunit GatB [Clostridiales bacterium]|nr:Asp-tRNA(Asn)/Glu-tRNA(Gln) amidotransferase subunit GatB [Clostridiales bacterium]
MKDYEIVIGLEVHVELSTSSKIFCGCSTKFSLDPNSNCCPVCTGMPGTLPVLNKKATEYAVAAGLALNCNIRKRTIFDRKNYFYPDLPKAYQISQLYFPIAENGHIKIELEGYEKVIGIHEMHLEEDAGKLIHDSDNNNTLIDYNRAGIPLIEIVSKPDMTSSDEVLAYLDKLKTSLQYLSVADCKMQEGGMRVDINLSVREVGDKKLGTRTEIKNLNSFRAIARAIESESNRQIELVKKGEAVDLETRRWDDISGENIRMRPKENVEDYRYFPDPDIPPIEFSDQEIDRIKSSLPEFREEKIIRFQKDYAIPKYDAKVLTSSKKMADIFENTANLCNRPKEVSNWLMVEGMRIIKDNNMDLWEVDFNPKKFSKLILMVEEGKINRTIAKEVFEKIFLEDIDPDEYVKKQGLAMISDDRELGKAALKILDKNPGAVSDYKNGKTKVLGYLVGQTMKDMGGRADPNQISKILKGLLEEI